MEFPGEAFTTALSAQAGRGSEMLRAPGVMRTADVAEPVAVVRALSGRPPVGFAPTERVVHRALAVEQPESLPDHPFKIKLFVDGGVQKAKIIQGQVNEMDVVAAPWLEGSAVGGSPYYFYVATHWSRTLSSDGTVLYRASLTSVEVYAGTSIPVSAGDDHYTLIGIVTTGQVTSQARTADFGVILCNASTGDGEGVMIG